MTDFYDQDDYWLDPQDDPQPTNNSRPDPLEMAGVLMICCALTGLCYVVLWWYT